jgi:hypothetical protein
MAICYSALALDENQAFASGWNSSKSENNASGSSIQPAIASGFGSLIWSPPISQIHDATLRMRYKYLAALLRLDILYGIVERIAQTNNDPARSLWVACPVRVLIADPSAEIARVINMAITALRTRAGEVGIYSVMVCSISQTLAQAG